MRYAFAFDASACTGCKACQVACKDKNVLPDGVLWRRVYEVSGGTWERHGAAWTNDVFAYNVSVGCNHCADPVCASACPTDAYVVRDDGIVWLDAGKCVGCEYCSWVCPYSAPQYSAELGRTTKCDFCRDLIDQGLPPACVAACPMRALDLVEAQTGAETQSGIHLWKVPAAHHPFPLTVASGRQPHLVVKPHRAMFNDLPKVVANREEVRPGSRGQRPGATGLGELPLVAFTLLGQAAAGVAVISLFMQSLSRPLLAAVGALIAAAALVSLLHLGTASRAWRAPANARRSPLSREILMLGVFAAACVMVLFVPAIGHVGLAIAGLALVYTMADVYRIEAVPGWTTWRTRATFAASALLLGAVVILAFPGIPRAVPSWAIVIAGLALVAQQVFVRARFYERLRDKTM